MTKRPSNCCRGCEKRHATCHVSCPDYIKFREELDEYNEEVRKERDKHNVKVATWNKTTRRRLCGR